MMTPVPYHILSDHHKELSEAEANTMSNLSSISVKIASAKEFSERDGKLAELNPFITAHVPKFQLFYDDVMDPYKVGNVPGGER